MLHVYAAAHAQLIQRRNNEVHVTAHWLGAQRWKKQMWHKLTLSRRIAVPQPTACLPSPLWTCHQYFSLKECICISSQLPCLSLSNGPQASQRCRHNSAQSVYLSCRDKRLTSRSLYKQKYKSKEKENQRKTRNTAQYNYQSLWSLAGEPRGSPNWVAGLVEV